MIPESVRLKIDWAKKHIDALDAEIAHWSSGPRNPRRLRRIRDGVPSTEFRAEIRFDPPLPETVPLLIGDAIHNLRSALDHLACALAPPTTSQTGHARIEFPICVSEDDFNAKGASRIKKLPERARDEIKSLQPYHAGDNARHEFLWALHQLDIIDKHRRISVLAGRYSLPDKFIPQARRGNEVIFEGRIYVPFEDGDIIRILGVDPEFEPDMTGTVAIRFGDRPDEVIEYGTLRHIHAHVSDHVIPQFAHFFKK
jgi:hypothetical protein